MWRILAAVVFVSASARAAVVDEFVGPDTVLVASAKVDAASCPWLAKLVRAIVGKNPAGRDVAQAIDEIQPYLAQVTEATLVLGAADVAEGSGPIIVLTLTDDADAQAIARGMRTVIVHGMPLDEVAKFPGQRLAIANNPTLRRISRGDPAPRPDLTQPLAELRSAHSFAAVLAPPADAAARTLLEQSLGPVPLPIRAALSRATRIEATIEQSQAVFAITCADEPTCLALEQGLAGDKWVPAGATLTRDGAELTLRIPLPSR